MSPDFLQALFGWMTVLNFGLLAILSFALMFLKPTIVRAHRWFLEGLNAADLERAYFEYLSRYKLLVVVFNFVPWLALHIVL